MRVSGGKINERERAMKNIPQETGTEEVSKMERLRARERTIGCPEKSMMENGRTGLNQGTACGRGLMENSTLESGKQAKLMGMGFTPGPMEINMKGNGKCS